MDTDDTVYALYGNTRRILWRLSDGWDPGLLWECDGKSWWGEPVDPVEKGKRSSISLGWKGDNVWISIVMSMKYSAVLCLF